MNVYASIAMSFIPLITVYACFLLLEEEFNKLHGTLACLCGLIALLPIELLLVLIHLYVPFNQEKLPERLVKVLLINGIVEESAKMVMMFLLPAKKTRLSVFFSYALLCGLTLGSLETLIYLINGNRSITLRLFTAVTMHTFCSGLSGLFVFSVKHKAEAVSKKFLWLPFAYAVLFHGLYNYFAGMYGPLHYFAYAVILITVVECKLRFESVNINIYKNAPTGSEQGDNQNMSFFNSIKKLFGASSENQENPESQTQTEQEQGTLAEQNQEDTHDDENQTASELENFESTEDVPPDETFATHTSAEFKSDETDSSDFTSDIKIVNLFEEDKTPEPDVVTEDEIKKEEIIVEKPKAEGTEETEETEGTKVTEKKTAAKKATSSKAAKSSATKKAETAPKAPKSTAAKKASAAKAAAEKKTTTKAAATKKAAAEKKTASSSASKTSKSAAKSTAAKASKTTAAKSTAAKASKTTTTKKAAAPKASAEKKTTSKAAATKKAEAEKKTASAKAPKAATSKSAATKASSTKKAGTSKKTTSKK